MESLEEDEEVEAEFEVDEDDEVANIEDEGKAVVRLSSDSFSCSFSCSGDSCELLLMNPNPFVVVLLSCLLYSRMSGKLANLSLAILLGLAFDEEEDDEDEGAAEGADTPADAGPTVMQALFLAAQGGGKQDSLDLRLNIGEGGFKGSIEAYEEKKASLLEEYLREFCSVALSLLLLLLLEILDGILDEEDVAGQSLVDDDDDVVEVDVDLGLDNSEDVLDEVASVVLLLLSHDQLAFNKDMSSIRLLSRQWAYADSGDKLAGCLKVEGG